MRFRTAIAISAATIVVGGCGDETIHQLPPAAEPPHSPATTTSPAGKLIRVGKRPEGVVVDPATGRVAVAERNPPALEIVGHKKVKLAGAPRHLALAGTTVLVPEETANSFTTVGLDGRPGRRVRVGAHPHAVTALTDGSVAVGNEASSTVSIIRHGRVRATVGVATQPGGLATLAGGRLLAVVSVRERVLETYDTRTFKRVSTTPAGVGPTHLACMGKTCWVVDTQGDSVLVFGDSGRSLTRRYDLPGGPYGIAIDPVHARLYVTLPALNQVVELPAQARPHVLRRWATPRQPDTVAVDPRRQKVYVTGTASNELQVISLASARPHS